jgi:chemotaxis protein CheD
MEILSVKMGEAVVAHNPAVLETHGVGSCIVIIIHDMKNHVGGMAHAMLPGNSADHNKTENHLRYVEDAVDYLVKGLEKLGGEKKKFTAKIIGGAEMFALYTKNGDSIGKQNIQSIKEKLEAESIAIRNEETGGKIGRSVSFDIASGNCSIETKM